MQIITAHLWLWAVSIIRLWPKVEIKDIQKIAQKSRWAISTSNQFKLARILVIASNKKQSQLKKISEYEEFHSKFVIEAQESGKKNIKAVKKNT